MNKIIEIKNRYEILHFDEYPILFIGKNYKSEIVIGSLIFEDDEDNTIKYFYSIVSENTALAFLGRKIPYLEVLKTALSIYIVTKDYNDIVLNIQETNFFYIDKSFLPLPSAYCPVVKSKTILKFKEVIEKIPRVSSTINIVASV